MASLPLTPAPRRRRPPPGQARLRRRLTPLAAPVSPGPYSPYCPLRPGTASRARGTRGRWWLGQSDSRARLADRALAEVGGGDVETAADLVRRAPGERSPLVENLDPVADVHDQGHVVVDQEHPGVVVVAHRADDRCELRYLGLREARRRLRPARPGRGRR